MLSPDALAQAQAIVARLGGISRDETYGCPDCADGGASWVQTWTEGRVVRSTYEFGRPPAILEEADGFLAGLIDALDGCAGTDIVVVEPGCTPRPPQGF